MRLRKRVRCLAGHALYILALAGVPILWCMFLIVVVAFGETADRPVNAPGVNIGAALLGLASLILGGLLAIIVGVGVFRRWSAMALAAILWVGLYQLVQGLQNLVAVGARDKGYDATAVSLLRLLAIVLGSSLALLVEAHVLREYRRFIRGQTDVPGAVE
jgi:hypothetical protein